MMSLLAHRERLSLHVQTHGKTPSSLHVQTTTSTLHAFALCAQGGLLYVDRNVT